MKKILIIASLFAAMFAAISCEEVSTEMDQNATGTYDIHYGLRKVIEYDPVNINGIDVCGYFDFFTSLKFTIHLIDGKMSSLSFDNADIPFSPFQFEAPSGTVDCELITTVKPYELRLKGTDNVIAYFKNGELYVPFQLDCSEISYEYRFREVNE